MAESHEPSYYEIALTNRQVIVAFVILLVCLLSAFFSGVWIGRESTARAEEQAVRNTPPSQVAQQGKNLEELEFFDSRSKKDGKKNRQEAPPQTSTDTTLLQDVGGSEPAPQTTVPPAGDEPAGEGEPAARPADAVPAAGETGAAEPDMDRKARRNKRNRAAEAAAAATPEPAVPKGAVVIQVFSSADRNQADRIRNRLVGGGYHAFLSPVDVGGHTMYRVRVGPFGSRADAQKTAEKVRKGYKLDTWVTE